MQQSLTLVPNRDKVKKNNFMRKIALFVLIVAMATTSSCDDGYDNDNIVTYEDVDLAIKIDPMDPWDEAWINRYNIDSALIYTKNTERGDSSWHYIIGDPQIIERLYYYKDSAWLRVEIKEDGQMISISQRSFDSPYNPYIREWKGEIVIVTKDDWN